MKKIIFGLAVLLGTAFFVPTTQISADNIGNANANSSPLKQKVDEKNGKKSSSNTTPKSSLGTNAKNGLGQDVKETNGLESNTSKADKLEDDIKDKLEKHDMDWVNSYILKNYKLYHEDGSITDFALGASHIVTDLFTAINLDIVYPLFDKALSTMFNLTGITNGINGVLTSVGQYSNKAWQSDALKGLLYLAFGVGLVWTFAKSIKSGGGLKSILTIVVIAVVGSAWVGAGSTVLSTINTLTSNAQTAVFVSTSDIKGAYSDTGDSFQNTLRYSYFEQAVERPFLLGNYGVATMADAEKDNDKMGNPYRLIGGNVDDTVISEFADKNQYISKKSHQEWYQSAIAFMSPVMSFAYGVPLLMIGLANLLVQLGAILLYYLAPFTIMISLLPKFANSALKTAMGAL